MKELTYFSDLVIENPRAKECAGKYPELVITMMLVQMQKLAHLNSHLKYKTRNKYHVTFTHHISSRSRSR